MRFTAILLVLMGVASARADEKVFSTCEEAQVHAKQSGKRVVLFVGCKANPSLCDVAHVAEVKMVKEVDEYPAQCIVISEAGGATRHAVLPHETSEAEIRKVLNPGPGADALDEVNAVRAKRGLPPFVRCPLLTIAAHRAASYRAARRMAGHTPNDFAHLPEGAHAAAAGCAAWPAEMGWGACCTYENWTYAGAAWVTGADGQRYMHLFVR